MVRQNFFSGTGKLFKISFGLVTTLFLLWLIFNLPHFTSEISTKDFLRVFLSYGVMASIIWANVDIRNKLFNISFLGSMLRFFLFLFPSLFFFYFLNFYIDPTGENLFSILSTVPVGIALIHAFVFATVESAIWQGFLNEKVGVLGSSLIAGLMHMYVWQTTPLFAIFGATLLFLFFSYVDYRFRLNKNDLIPVIAVHTAYNVIKLGFLLN